MVNFKQHLLSFLQQQVYKNSGSVSIDGFPIIKASHVSKLKYFQHHANFLHCIHLCFLAAERFVILDTTSRSYIICTIKFKFLQFGILLKE